MQTESIEALANGSADDGGDLSAAFKESRTAAMFVRLTSPTDVGRPSSRVGRDQELVGTALQKKAVGSDTRAPSSKPLQPPGISASHAALIHAVREWAQDPFAVFYSISSSSGKMALVPEDVIGISDAELLGLIMRRVRAQNT
jgi:hypothetical protein